MNIDAGQAFENTMSNSSKTAKEMAQNLGESVKNIEDATRRGNLLDNGLAEVNRQLDSMTLKAKLASFAVNTLKTVLNMAANVAITWAVTKGFELLVNYINREKNAIEETKENIQNLKSTLEDNQDKISDIIQQLEENKQKISEINASPLSITQAEDLDNLKMQNLELENQLELLKIINSSRSHEIVSRALDTDLYVYLQPAATNLMLENRKFAVDYLSSLKELDEFVKNNHDARLGEKLYFILKDFVKTLTDWKLEAETQSPATELYKRTWTICRNFILPMNPQRTELDYAVRKILLTLGIKVRPKKTRKTYPAEKD